MVLRQAPWWPGYSCWTRLLCVRLSIFPPNAQRHNSQLKDVIASNARLLGTFMQAMEVRVRRGMRLVPRIGNRSQGLGRDYRPNGKQHAAACHSSQFCLYLPNYLMVHPNNFRGICLLKVADTKRTQPEAIVKKSAHSIIIFVDKTDFPLGLHCSYWSELGDC